MKNQEAIEILKDLWRYEHSEYYEQEVREALEKGIEALENRNSTIEELEKIKRKMIDCFSQEDDIDSDHYNHALDIAISIVHDSIIELKGENK